MKKFLSNLFSGVKFRQKIYILTLPIPLLMSMLVFIINTPNSNPFNPEFSFVNLISSQNFILTTIICLVFAGATIFFSTLTSDYFLDNINSLKSNIDVLSQGKIPPKIGNDFKDEMGEMTRGFDVFSAKLTKTIFFLKELEVNNFGATFDAFDEKGDLGSSIASLKKGLEKTATEIDQKHKEEQKRNWVTIGQAKFGEILRQNNDNMEVLSFDILKNLVKYTEMNQGGLFVLNDEDKDKPFLKMTACYAFNRQKFINKTIEIGEGLVGACYQEGKTIFLTEIPDNYIEITSGLGEANPKSVLIVPLKLNEIIYGIIEFASFKIIESHEIEFIEKVAESIASTISSVKVNVRTAQLLEMSQIQSEEMRAQEEEMRQNMEEMHATQEEMARKDDEQKRYVNSLLDKIEKLKYRIEH